jgi:glycosyltransferase involved in cell wall biosynthesis
LWNEPFGLVAAEAAQMGRPLIASNIGGIPEIVVHNETGLLVQPGNVEELADAMLLLLKNPDFANQLGENARKNAGQKFSMHRCAAEYGKIYDELLGN